MRAAAAIAIGAVVESRNINIADDPIYRSRDEALMGHRFCCRDRHRRFQLHTRDQITVGRR